jgi:tetratricopeptide (TPR) repeat protein
MFFKFIKLLIIISFYQSQLFSKSNSFNDLNSKNLSNYFSGIVASENKINSEALDFFNSSKALLNEHDPYLERYVNSLVLEKKIAQAINIVKYNKGKKNSDFFDAYVLLIIDSFKKNNFDDVEKYLIESSKYRGQSKFNLAILGTLEDYLITFKEKKISTDKKNLSNLSLITKTFQKCYLNDKNTSSYFLNLINSNESDYSRYKFFYISYLIENKKLDQAKKITEKLELINTTLLLSQSKSWIENKKFKEFSKIFSCQNHNDIISEFLFLISNLYSSQNNFEKSNFYLNISNYLNPKFKFNLTLVVENSYQIKNFRNVKETLKNFDRENEFYYWYRVKKEAQIITKEQDDDKSLNYIISKFNKIENPNIKIIFDMANIYKSSKNYEKSIDYFTKIIATLGQNSEIKSDLLYRRGGSYERLKDYKRADQDLLNSIKIKPNDAYVLNYLAYSWLERNYKIKEAISMLKKAYSISENDPYIIDSIGWAYYLIDEYSEAERYIKRAVELMPTDPIVNDHYGDILWKLDRKIQARYFWISVLSFDDTKDDMRKKINVKLIEGPKNSQNGI